MKGVKVLTHRADQLERGQLRTLVDNLKQKLGEGVVVLASAQPEGKVAIIAGVTPGLVKRIQAGKLVGAVAKLVGGSGGGKPEIAEAGGKDQSQIDAALKAATEDCRRALDGACGSAIEAGLCYPTLGAKTEDAPKMGRPFFVVSWIREKQPQVPSMQDASFQNANGHLMP